MNRSKKHTNLLAVTGIHSVSALLDEHFDCVVKVWMLADCGNARVLALADKTEKQSIALEVVKAAKLDAINGAHQGILAWCRPPPYRDFYWLQQQAENMRHLLLLDKITDCHNFGACLRTAEAAGIDAVLVPYRHTSALNTGAAKSASGALYRLPLIQVQLTKALQELKEIGYDIIGLSEHAGKSVYQLPEREKTVLALGSEETGLSSAVMSQCAQLVHIPCSGVNSSLNVSVAAGIAMFALKSQTT